MLKELLEILVDDLGYNRTEQILEELLNEYPTRDEVQTITYMLRLIQ